MVRPAEFEIKQSVNGSTATLAIAGELDMRTTGQLIERVTEQLSRGADEVTLDMAELRFLDSSGLKVLIDLHYRSREDGWRLRLIAPRDEAAILVLRATGADKALPFTEATST